MPCAPVVVERAGGGVARFPPDPDARARLRRITREACRALGCDRGSVWRMSPTGQGIRVVTRFVAGDERHDDEIRFPEALGVYAARVLRRLSVLAMEDAEIVPDLPPALAEYLRAEGIRALLAVPVRPSGLLEGFLCVEHHARPRRWSPHDRARAVAWAQQVERSWAGAADARQPGKSVDPGLDPAPDSAGEAEGTSVSEGTSRAEPEEKPALAPEPAPPDEDAEGTGEGGEVQASGRPPGVGPGIGRELRARLARLRAMETSGILATDLAREILQLLEIQDGHLALLASSFSGDEDGRELLMDARDLGARARASLEELLAWARRGGTDGSEKLELNAFLGGLAGRLGTLTGERVRLVFAPSHEPILIRGSARFLSRAVEHLIRNAREASPPGARVRLAVTRGERRPGGEIVRIRVEDEGAGIAPGDLPWIFEPFFSTRGRHETDGMGLALVQAVVEGHGGWVDVRSTHREGTVFTVNLPILEPPSQRTRAADDDEEGAPDGRPLAVLVEDDPDLSKLIERSLEQAGYRVLATDGLPGAERLLAPENEDPALLVVERVLPDGTRGGEVLRTLRSATPYLAGMVVDRRLRDRGPGAETAIREADGIARDVPLLGPPFQPDRIAALARSLRPSGSAPSADLSGGNGREDA